MHLSYRPEVDGLRTLAVMAVLIFHAELPFGDSFFLKGGFLGVDIFFVISGFLITSLIIKEYGKTGKFSILNFYHRRIRRLLPALLFVILITLPFAWLYLLPQSFIDFSYSQLASIFFSSNIYWHLNLQDYGAESALLKPFLHTWSLAVEEQFYFIYPVALLIIYRYMRSYTVLLLILSILLSLQFAEMLTSRNISLSFYMLPSRFWELASGAVLAHLVAEKKSFLFIPFLQKYLPTIGAALILYSFWNIGFSSNHPGYVTIPAIIGTLFIIGFSGHNDIITKVLSSKLFVGIGLISYSLYLWHYPIFAFARIISIDINALDIGICFALSFILAFLSYRFIEKPFRNGKINTKRALSILAGVSLITIAINTLVSLNAGFPQRLPNIVATASTGIDRSILCNKPKKCTYNKEHSKDIYLLGDSHMMVMEAAFLQAANKKKYRLTTLNRSECQYVPNLDRIDRITSKPHKCTAEYQDFRRNTLLNSNPGIIMIGGRLATLLNEDYFDNTEGGKESDLEETYEGLQQRILQNADKSLSTKQQRTAAIILEYQSAIKELAEYGHKIILIYPIPEVGWNVPKTIMKRLQGLSNYQFESALKEQPVTTSSNIYMQRQRTSFAVLDSIKHSNIYRIYPHKIFCDSAISNRCITHDQENLFYRDDDHLSLHGTQLLLAEIIKLPIF